MRERLIVNAGSCAVMQMLWPVGIKPSSDLNEAQHSISRFKYLAKRLNLVQKKLINSFTMNFY